MDEKSEKIINVKEIGKSAAWITIILALAIFSDGLHINYWQFYDLGELFPNRVIGFSVLLPSLMIILGISKQVTIHLFRKVNISNLSVNVLTFIVLFVISLIPFIFEVIRSSKNVPNHDLIAFIFYYFGR